MNQAAHSFLKANEHKVPQLALLLREFLLKNSPSYKSPSAMYLSFILCVLSYLFIINVGSCSSSECLYIMEFKMNKYQHVAELLSYL